MNLGRPYATITHPLDMAALTVLVGTTRPLTGREVARLAPEGTPSGIWSALSRLVEQGLVFRDQAGRSMLYTLNREHLAAPAAEMLARARGELHKRLSEAVDNWEVPADHASMFGSAARGDGDIHSDIDLFIVRPADVDEDDVTWREQIDSLAERTYVWTGNHAGIAEVSADELSELRERSPALATELESDGIELAGKKLSSTLGRA